MYILITILAVTAAVFLILYIRMVRTVKKLAQTTRDIRTGNLNMRYRTPLAPEELENLGGELNRLVDDIQNSFERVSFLEEERKRIISNISHDLRTPLTALLGYLEALQRDETLTAEERENFLNIAVSKGNTLLVLIQDFFDLARFEEENSEPELQRVNISELLQEVLLNFYPNFVQADITPVLVFPESPIYTHGNAGYIRRIINNLLSNALRYGDEGKEIGINLREEANLVWVDVWDKGRGIAAHDLPHVFERMYTGEASRNNSLRGTGLGLTIAKTLVEKQGGQITVTSEPNEKTVFSFCLTKY